MSPRARTQVAIVALLAFSTVGCASAPPPPTPHAPTSPPTTPSREATPSPTARLISLPPASSTSAPATDALTAPPADELERDLTTPGTLTACIAVVGGEAASLNEEGELVGYNVSFAEELAERLDLRLATRSPLFEDLIEAVRDHTCDVSVSSQNITQERLVLLDFVPYTESIQPVLVASGNPLEIDALEDLCGLAVSTTSGTTHVDLVNGTGDYTGRGLNDGCADAQREPIELQTYETEAHAVTALLTGDAVAYLGNPSFAADFPGRIERSPATLPQARQGITTAKDRPALHAAVAAIVGDLIADGTYREILIRHLPNDESVRIVSIVE